MLHNQGWIREFSPPLSFPPLPFLSLALFPSSFPLVDPLNQLGVWEHCKLPAGYGAEPRPKTNSVHSKAVRKPLVTIIMNILNIRVLYV